MSEEFNDRMFRLINNLPPTEPEREHTLECGPSAPGAFQKMHEKILLESYLGQPLANEAQADFSLEELSKRFSGEPKITPTFASDLHKRARDFEPKHSSGAVRFEEEIVGSNRWRHGYNERDELVSAYLLGPE